MAAALASPITRETRFYYGVAGRLIRDEDAAGGHKALARSATARGFEVDVATAMGRTSAFEVQDLPDGSRRHVTTGPSGLKGFRLVDETGTVRKALAPDGTRTEATEAPDPRFGTQSPYASSAEVTTPGGLSASVAAGREATLANPTDPLSATSLTEKLTVNGKTTASTWEKATGKVATVSPGGRRSSATLDSRGRVVLEEATGLAPTRYAYDGRGRTTEATTTDGANPRTTTYAYDARDRLTGVTDPAGRTTAYAYDDAGRATRQTLPDGRAVSYSYDKNGNLTSLTPPQRSPHEFGHTARDQRSSYTPPAVNGETAEARATTWQYNPDRQPTSATKPGGEAVSFAYDPGGRLASVAHPGGETTYSYDPQTGNLAGAAEAGGQGLSFSYDGFLPTKEALTGAVSGEVAQSYDADFRPVEQTVNGGNPVAYSYDGDGLLTKAGSETVTRAADTGLATATALGRTTDSRAFNAFGEPKAYSALHGSSKLHEASYERDSLGRITSKTETMGTTTSTHAYSYDKAGRLTEVKKDGATVASYAYDANGNRISRTDASGNKTNATIGAQDRLLAYGQNQYRYSADGDLATKTSPQGTTTYSYDALGGLKTVVLPGGKRVEYLVDPQGRRVGKKVDGALKQGWLWSGSVPVAELGASGNVVSRFVYGTKPNVPDYMVRGGKTYRIVSDHLGSPRLVVDAETGEVAQRVDYDEFGVVTRDTNPGFQPFGFAGGLYDPDTGLVRFGARDYDPETGRWTAKDPILFAGGDTNLYGYVLGDPVNLVDPNGLRTGGLCASGEVALPGFGGSLQVCAVSDGKNIGATLTYGLGPETPLGEGKLFSLSGAASVESTNAEYVADLGGPSGYAGWAAGQGVVAHGSTQFCYADDGEVEASGAELGIGPGIRGGLPAGVEGGGTRTHVLADVPIKDFMQIQTPVYYP